MDLAPSLPVGQTRSSMAGSALALLEPLISIAVLWLCTRVHGARFDNATALLSLLIFALSFPSRANALDRRRTLFRDVFATWPLICFLLLLFGYSGGFLSHFNSGALAAWALATPFAVLLGHIALARTVRAIASEHARRALIVGVNPLARSLVERITDNKHLGLEFCGFVDDRDPQRIDPGQPPALCGKVSDLPGQVRAQQADVVYITLPMSSHPRILSILNSLQDTTASIYFVPDITMFDLIQARVDEVQGIPVLAVCETPFQGVSGTAKRLLDVVVSLSALVMLLPLLLGVAALIRIESAGPIIFRQRRYGLDGQEIIVWKFRSMTVTEDGDQQYRQVVRGDSRVTRVGRIIRATSIDELPQLFNVLQGKMSIVGPRPHAVAVNERYRKLISGYMVRHKVRPGITGWAQVNGYRGGDEIEHMRKRIEYDLEYLRHWSLGLDLRIMFRTVALVLRDARAF